MPTAHDIMLNKERLYESSSLRDDLNDDEAEVLLKWGEEQVDRIATDYADELEEKARFLRQLLKNINRFVGQREFNELEGQRKYLSKVVLYLPQLGWDGITEDMIFEKLPEDKADMMGNLRVILHLLTPSIQSESGAVLAAINDGQPAPKPPSLPAPTDGIEPVSKDTPPVIKPTVPDDEDDTDDGNPNPWGF